MKGSDISDGLLGYGSGGLNPGHRICRALPIMPGGYGTRKHSYNVNYSFIEGR